MIISKTQLKAGPFKLLRSELKSILKECISKKDLMFTPWLNQNKLQTKSNYKNIKYVHKKRNEKRGHSNYGVSYNLVLKAVFFREI